MPGPKALERLLTVAELAELTRVPLATVYKWLHAGAAPRSYKIGKRRLFRPEDVAVWLEQRADGPRPAA